MWERASGAALLIGREIPEGLLSKEGQVTATHLCGGQQNYPDPKPK